ncbi:hypothetical protein EAH_00047440 [Eimeria acervulina]|uniref:Uncharacterized protein n=1 Tax=Eimeria acervulina TaxID=5801 RepID=U6GMT7_EIMAC|nr:hypothetical protein EAH_00047440 [Eimeria acervulina]CDI79939.1 hypothetical protein EAH_00047440 [Eimeria acervulina]
MSEPGGGGPVAAAGAAAAGAAAAEGGDAPQEGFLSRMGGMLLKVMIFQAALNAVASFFSPSSTPMLQQQQQQQPLRNVLQPGAPFDAFIHLHYLPSSSVSVSTRQYSEPLQQYSVLEKYKASFGVGVSPLADVAAIEGKIALKTLFNQQEQQRTYCASKPAAAAAAAAAAGETSTAAAAEEEKGTAAKSKTAEETAGKAAGAAAAAAGATAAGAAAAADACGSRLPLPPAFEVWRLMNATYTYDWWSRSLEHEMTEEEAVAAAAALPEARLIQQTRSLVQVMVPFKAEETQQHSLLFGGEEESQTEESPGVPVRHLKNRFDVSLVYDSSVHNSAALSAGPLQRFGA